MGSVLNRVAVCGAGGIGCWLAAKLVRTGAEVHLLGRPDRIEALRQNGLTLETLADASPKRVDERETVRGLALYDRAADLPRPDLLVVATRAYQTETAADILVEAAIRPGSVLTLQNGLGNAEVLADRFGSDRVLAGTTSHGVTWVDPATARHAGAGDTRIGAWTPEGRSAAEATATLFGRAGIPTEAVPDPRVALWAKVAVNAAINPPTAIHSVLNGALLEDPVWANELREAAREVARVASAEGVPLDEEAMAEAAVEVARRTARNRSSMLQARAAGRRLETDAITGEVVDRAARHGLDVPVNRRHLAALRALGP